MESWLHDSGTELYSAYNKGKSLDAEIFIRTFRHMTAVSKKVYFDKLDNIVDKCNNIYQIRIKIKPVNLELQPWS